jgi:exopolysaccharide biosynthesis polyprenyl glycosylphosphotransferase
VTTAEAVSELNANSQQAIWPPPGGGASPSSLASANADDPKFIELSASGSAVAAPPFGLTEEDNSPRRVSRGWLLRRLLVLADLLGLFGSLLATGLLFSAALFGGLGTFREVLVIVVAIGLWMLAAEMQGLYDRDNKLTARSTAGEFVGVFHLVTLGVWLVYPACWILGLAMPRPAIVVTFWLFAIATISTARAAARAIVRRQPGYLQNTIIVGAGDVGQLIGRKLLHHPEYGVNLIGFVDGEPKERRSDLRDLQLVGVPDELPTLIEHWDVDRVIVAFSNDRHEELLDIVHSLRRYDVQIDLVPRLFEAVDPNVGIHTIEGLPLLGLPPCRIPRLSRVLKRCLDLTAASALLVLAAPLMGLLALLIRWDSPGPALFRQTRLGMKMEEFTFFKFRTMHDGTNDGPHREYIRGIMDSAAVPGSNNLYKLERPAEVTRVGRWLRMTSLDELPQLLNVILGDMSLVGPRPCIPYEIEHFKPRHFERFLVPSGLTGLWQVEARAHSTFGEALDLDVSYARGWSLGLDLRLLARTPALIFRKRGTG